MILIDGDLRIIRSGGDLNIIRHGESRFPKNEDCAPGCLNGTKETPDVKWIKNASGLSAPASKLKRLGYKYISHVSPGSTCGSVSRATTTTPYQLLPYNEPQNVDVTNQMKGGDCDDLALLFAYFLKNQLSDPNLEYGIVIGYVRLCTEIELYGSHALLAIRDKRSPNKYYLWDITNIKDNPLYVGTYTNKGSKGPSDSNNSFISNIYIPVTHSGTLDKQKIVSFVR